MPVLHKWGKNRQGLWQNTQKMYLLLTTQTALDKLLPAFLTFFLCVVVMKIVSALSSRLLGATRSMDDTLRGFVKSAIKIVLWLLTAIIVADTLGIPTTSLVALFSVAGLALSLSVQNIMANLFSGITLLMTRPFAVGDWVEVAGQSGSIKSIGLFYTVLATGDNKTISLPNSNVTASTLVNYNTEAKRRVDMIFSASYDDDTQKVKAAIMEAVMADARIEQEPAPFVGLKEYKASSIDYLLRVWVKNDDYWDVYYSLNEAVRESFDRNSVTMTYEHINVHMVKE